MMSILIPDIKQIPCAIPAQTPALSRSVWMHEDQNLKKRNPVVYHNIARQLKEKRIFREHLIDEFSSQLSTVLSDTGFTARISGRPKHIYSIHKKMCHQHLPFEGIQDLNGLRIVMEQAEDCYLALHTVHRLWPPVPGRFDDYICIPKKSGYQSLHTTVTSGDNTMMEIQIRTIDMHYEAEYGRAAHWRYKLIVA